MQGDFGSAHLNFDEGRYRSTGGHVCETESGLDGVEGVSDTGGGRMGPQKSSSEGCAQEETLGQGDKGKPGVVQGEQEV